MSELPPAARRVEAAAKALALNVAIREMPASTRTAGEAATAVGATVGQIVKSLVFMEKQSRETLLFLVSGSNRVNEKAVGERLGLELARPDADFVRAATGFAIGGIPPFGHATPLRTWLDEDLLQYGTVWAAAGTPTCVFSVSPDQLRTATGATVIRLT